MRRIDILFTGLIREKHIFLRSLLDMLTLRERGFVRKIIFSTWKGEIDAHPELAQFFKREHIALIETEEPHDRGPASIWCQMKAMEVGLKEIPSDTFVLKTRSEVHINPDFIEKLARDKEKLLYIRENLKPQNIFKYKIWVPWFDHTRPFYMGDECFFGIKEDLAKLLNYEDAFEKEYNMQKEGLAHIRRFIHPFLEQYPIFKEFLRQRKSNQFNEIMRTISDTIIDLKKITFIKNVYQNREVAKLQEKLFDSDFIQALAMYYYLLYSHFYIDSRSYENQVSFREFSKPRQKLNSENISNNFQKENIYGADSKRVFSYDMEFINALCEKKSHNDMLSHKLLEEISKVTGSSKPS